MTTVEEIEAAVSKLTFAELKKFRDWFDAFDARLFDEKIEQDAKTGRLDELAADAHFRSDDR
jgi:hypothetical protein